MCQERKGKKMGLGKERERTLFFPFPFSIFWHPFFTRFWPKSWKRLKKEAEWWKNCWKDVERGSRVILPLSKFSKLARFRFLYHLNPIFVPFKTCSWPRPNAVLAPFFSRSWSFLYYLPIISRYAPLSAQPLDHVGPSLVCRTNGRFVFMVRRR